MRLIAAAALALALSTAFAAARPEAEASPAPNGLEPCPPPAFAPCPTNFNLAAGVIWKKYRKVKDKYVLGKPAEGNALMLLRAGLKSRNAELAAEARTILDAIEATRDLLGERLVNAVAEGRPGTEEWIRLYLRSYPSRRPRFTRKPPKNHQTSKPSNP